MAKQFGMDAINRLRAVFDPARYHGWGRTRRYFEGWYFKVVDAPEKSAYAFIPGIAMNGHGERHAFVQVLDGKRLTAEYHTFRAEAFRPAPGKFDLTLGDNRFTEEFIRLALPGIRGELRFRGNVPWPVRWYSPGIMGPYAFVPRMECYHGILSMDHALEGLLQINGQRADFTGGRGYIEKDWGHSFPSAYFWMQSNHFGREGISFKASVARIPWMGSSFTGLIAGVWFDGELHRFTTYNGSVLRRSIADLEKVELVMENRGFRLEVRAHRHEATALAAPLSGFMDGRISESMTSTIDLILTDKKQNRILLQDSGRHAALEVAGEIGQITILG